MSTEAGDAAVLRRALRRLRFEPLLEAAFRDEYERGGLIPRAILCALAAVLVALTPLYDLLLLHPPESFVPLARRLQFGVQVPALLIALVATLTRLRRFSPAATVFAALCTGGGLFAQRIIGAEHGFAVPFDFVSISVAAVYFLARLRFALFFPFALLLMLAVTVAELHTFGATSAALYNCLSLWMMFALASTGGWIIERNARENWYQRRQLAEQALHDPLTGLPNRRQFDERLLQLLRQAAREKGDVALLLLDLDDFKSYNDRYGHPAGDACLQHIADWLAGQMQRPHDFCARLGGEEFAAVWFNAGRGSAVALADELRAGVAALGISKGNGVVTASGGFAEVVAPNPEHAMRGVARELIKRADDLLYKAKDAGRDRLYTA